MFGPGQHRNYLIPYVLRMIRDNRAITLHHGKDERDYIYVDDVVSTILRCCQWRMEDSEIINIGSGISHENIKIAKILVELSGKSISIRNRQDGENSETEDCFADISKAQLKLKWEPQHSLRDGLKIAYRRFMKKRLK